MEKEKKQVFPKGFFTKERPKVSFEDSVKDDIPFVWSDSVLEGKTKVKIVGVDSKNSKKL